MEAAWAQDPGGPGGRRGQGRRGFGFRDGRDAASLAKPPQAKDDAERKILAVLSEMEQSEGYANVSPTDGRFLRLIAETIGAKKVVELGTSTGYSGVWMALALQKTGGHLYTHEIDEGRAKTAQGYFDKAGVSPLVTIVMGDAHETVAQHVAAGGGRAIRGRSTPYGASSPYSAFAQHVKQVAGVFDSDELDDARRKLRRGLEELLGPASAEEHAPPLEILVGIEGEDAVAERETLFFSARVLVEALAREAPTLLVFEDIHWADASLLDLLETLASRARDVPLLLLALARPEILSERPGWGGGLPAYTALPLERLSDEASRTLAERLLERLEAADAPAEVVARTGEGNPLFIEELAASLAEHSTRDAGHLPTSVRAIVSARLDALPPGERSVLVDASVVGRVFWRGALAEMEPRDGLSAVLGSLEERDLIRREAVSRIVGDQQFAFKHGLIHDVAYATLPRAARRDRHAAVARYLQATTSGAGQSHEALGHHFREAGDSERAVEHLVAAAEQAGRGWAKERALTLYGEAFELLPDEDGERRRQIRLQQVVLAQAVWHMREHDVRRAPPD